MYTIKPKPTYTLTVQNGVALSGIINEDMTLTNDKLWILENNVLIPEGVTVTVEPGTRIQFWSADPNNKYGASANVYLQVEGRFIAEGTEEQPIEMFPGKGFEDKTVTITGQMTGLSQPDSQLIDDDYEKAYVSLKYVNILNAEYADFDSNLERAFNATTIDHCSIIHNITDEINWYVGIYACNISNTRFENIDEYYHSFAIYVENFYNNSMDNCDVAIYSKYGFKNNVILNYFVMLFADLQHRLVIIVMTVIPVLQAHSLTMRF